ncbi:MAG: hypothetical protein KBC84_09135, partial [Proteobacteria bacterium]|nr:hypothetical protein [Pseudomonadota bacterium]
IRPAPESSGLGATPEVSDIDLPGRKKFSKTDFERLVFLENLPGFVEFFTIDDPKVNPGKYVFAILVPDRENKTLTSDDLVVMVGDSEIVDHSVLIYRGELADCINAIKTPHHLIRSKAPGNIPPQYVTYIAHDPAPKPGEAKIRVYQSKVTNLAIGLLDAIATEQGSESKATSYNEEQLRLTAQKIKYTLTEKRIITDYEARVIEFLDEKTSDLNHEMIQSAINYIQYLSTKRKGTNTVLKKLFTRLANVKVADDNDEIAEAVEHYRVEAILLANQAEQTDLVDTQISLLNGIQTKDAIKLANAFIKADNHFSAAQVLELAVKSAEESGDFEGLFQLAVLASRIKFEGSISSASVLEIANVVAQDTNIYQLEVLQRLAAVQIAVHQTTTDNRVTNLKEIKKHIERISHVLEAMALKLEVETGKAVHSTAKEIYDVLNGHPALDLFEFTSLSSQAAMVCNITIQGMADNNFENKGVFFRNLSLSASSCIADNDSSIIAAIAVAKNDLELGRNEVCKEVLEYVEERLQTESKNQFRQYILYNMAEMYQSLNEVEKAKDIYKNLIATSESVESDFATFIENAKAQLAIILVQEADIQGAMHYLESIKIESIRFSTALILAQISALSGLRTSLHRSLKEALIAGGFMTAEELDLI